MQRFFGLQFDLVQRFRVPLVITLIVVSLLGAHQATRLELDMSFRPLFVDDPVELARNDALEAEFGQLSGAHIGVVFESDAILEAEFLSRLEELSSCVAALPHVTDVQSLTRLEQVGDGDGDAASLASRLDSVLRADPDSARDLLSAGQRATVLWARLDLPLSDLEGRRPVVHAFRDLVASHTPADARAHLVGVSVVEDAYAVIVLRGLALSVGLTTIAISLVLFLVYGRARSVLVAMAGLSAALPVVLGAMHVLGRSMTIVGSMIPTMVMVIGVADAIHVLDAFRNHVSDGTANVREAARRAMAETGLACLMTTLTTVAGFLSLRFASLSVIRDFGTMVALGVCVVHVTNQILLPVLLLRLVPTVRKQAPLERCLTASVRAVSRVVLGRPKVAALSTGAIFALLGLAVPSLVVQQRFNEEVHAGHPVRVAQEVLEREFGGILGPEVTLTAPAATSVLDEKNVAALQLFESRIEGRRGVTHVSSLIDGEAKRTTLVVRIEDLGTEHALAFVHWIERTAADTLGPDWSTEVWGQWWLAQRGMANLLDDMLESFAAACVLVLPFLFLALRDRRLFLLGLLPNFVPTVSALGFMALTGIPLRVGTAMILAIALGIAIDDTIHFLTALQREERSGRAPRQAVERALARTGRSVLVTTLVLVLGFLAMSVSEVLALRDMGILGAVTLVTALLADVVLAPALYLLIARKVPQRHPAL